MRRLPLPKPRQNLPLQENLVGVVLARLFRLRGIITGANRFGQALLLGLWLWLFGNAWGFEFPLRHHFENLSVGNKGFSKTAFPACHI
jgi:hypothetical protein